jgi:hypothetical protein
MLSYWREVGGAFLMAAHFSAESAGWSLFHYLVNVVELVWFARVDALMANYSSVCMLPISLSIGWFPV